MKATIVIVTGNSCVVIQFDLLSVISTLLTAMSIILTLSGRKFKQKVGHCTPEM